MTSTVPVKPGRLETVLFYFNTGKYSSNSCAVLFTWNCSVIDGPYLRDVCTLNIIHNYAPCFKVH